MRLNADVIKNLMTERNFSQNELARLMNVGRGSLSNALSGRREAGRKILAGLLTIFPKESVASLTIDERPMTRFKRRELV